MSCGSFCRLPNRNRTPPGPSSRSSHRTTAFLDPRRRQRRRTGGANGADPPKRGGRSLSARSTNPKQGVIIAYYLSSVKSDPCSPPLCHNHKHSLASRTSYRTRVVQYGLAADTEAKGILFGYVTSVLRLNLEQTSPEAAPTAQSPFDLHRPHAQSAGLCGGPVGPAALGTGRGMIRTNRFHPL
jgi:hypothetical protein